MANLVLGGGGGEAAAYTIDQSLRFNSGDTAFMHRTPASEGNRRTWTFSTWAKRVDLADEYIFAMVAGYNDAGWFTFGWASDGKIQIVPGYNYNQYRTTELYRDFGAWYHLCLRCDTTQSTWATRLRLYVNGVLQTLVVSSAQSEGEPAQDAILGINDDLYHTIGKYQHGTNYLNGYLAETYLIDGTSLGPDSFAETDEDTNQWKPIDASGLTFDTNGFYLKFQDSSDFGDDSSGEGNDWTVTNLVATDQMKDSPTNNFATWNPLNVPTSSGPTFSEGNLQTVEGNGWGGSSTIEQSSGKWYAEFLVASHTGSVQHVIGVDNDPAASAKGDEYPGRYSTGWGYYGYDGDSVTGGSLSSYGDTYDDGDIIGIALDLENDNLYFSKNNTWQNSGDPTSGATGTGALSITTAKSWAFAAGNAAGAPTTTWVANFGSDSSFAGNETAGGNADSNGVGDFFYEPPSLFLALCTSNLSDPSIALPGDNFNTVLYTGDGATTLAVTGVGFAPDFTWIKNRDAADKNVLVDSVRGATNYLSSDSNAAEVDDSTFVASLDSDGFTVGDDVVVNTNTENYASWNWLAGGTPTETNIATTGVMTSGSVFQNGVSNTSFTPGSTIYPTKISANTTSGFSIVSYTGNETVTQTVAHGLSSAPNMVIVKNLGYTTEWAVGSDEETSWSYYLYLNDSRAETNASSVFGDAPDASVFKIGDATATNGAYNYLAYCFHSVAGYSAMGTYVGNNSTDGVFNYLGFRPAFILLKGSSSSSDWHLFDSKRIGYNVANYDSTPSESVVEVTSAQIDLLSNGFKIRINAGNINHGHSYMYYASAESPFKYANAR